MSEVETALLGLGVSFGLVALVYGIAWTVVWLDKRENRLR